ncbi:MAG: T9SS type A sorting domain-containing protein [Chitinophagaceae bacterium]
MKKGLLLIGTCLLVMLCHAQEISSPELPAQDSILITDLAATVKENSKVSLNWHMARSSAQSYITIERSNNGKDFEVVAILRQSANVQQDWLDEAAPKGRNLYRIRYTDNNGQVNYTKTAATLIAGDISFRFYPNPVDNVLIVRTEAALDVQIIDVSGRARINQNKLQGLQTINVSSLEKGIYYLIVYNRITGTSSQERLVKN